VREDGGDGEAAGALDVHEEGAGLGHKGLYSDILSQRSVRLPMSWFLLVGGHGCRRSMLGNPIHLPCPRVCRVLRISNFGGFVP
jgi:hypothetical protein